jgi:MraZ protein
MFVDFRKIALFIENLHIKNVDNRFSWVNMVSGGGKKWEVLAKSGRRNMITGEFRCSLDEKGRLLIPAKMRADIIGNIIILTRGVEKCLWLFPPEEWKTFSEKLIGSTSLLQEQARLIQRRMIAPAQEAEFDRTGRIMVPQTLREYSELKKECIVLGLKKYIEIWAETAYLSYLEENESKFKQAAEQLGGKIAL